METCININEHQTHSAEDHTWYDFIYTKCPEKANLQRLRTDVWLSHVEGMSWLQTGIGQIIRGNVTALNLNCGDARLPLYVFKSELYTYSEWILQSKIISSPQTKIPRAQSLPFSFSIPDTGWSLAPRGTPHVTFGGSYIPGTQKWAYVTQTWKI